MSKTSWKLLALVGACAVVVSAVALSQAGDKFEAVPTGDQKLLLERTAGEMAVMNQGKVPATAEVVLTSRQTSQDLVAGGDQVFADEPVYLVQMEGSFTVTGPAPEGFDAPVGIALWFLVDAETGQRLDWGVGPKLQDLSSLGEVSTIEPIPPG